MGTGALSPAVNVPGHGREYDHTPASSGEVKNAWSYSYTPTHVFIAWCLMEHQGQFCLYSSLFLTWLSHYCSAWTLAVLMQDPTFNSRPVYLGCIVDKLALKLVFVKALQFFL